MKSEKNILIAFLLNISFSIFELIGGIFTKSVAIVSDAIHDFGDALSIGISFVLEKISHKKPDEHYTFGYGRYSVLGAILSNSILLSGSIIVIYSSIKRVLNPVEVNYNGMIILAIIGVLINYLAAYNTSKGQSLNQKTVNLHMLEDVMGWTIVLIGAIVMRFTDISIIDPILSIIVSVYILINALAHFKEVANLFLEKTPIEISVGELKKHLLEIKGIVDVHHIHVWSMDGINNFATMHVVTTKGNEIKKQIREELCEHGINHVTIELEKKEDKCTESECSGFIESSKIYKHHHHH